jgi:hypothetical protein
MLIEGSNGNHPGERHDQSPRRHVCSFMAQIIGGDPDPIQQTRP